MLLLECSQPLPEPWQRERAGDQHTLINQKHHIFWQALLFPISWPSKNTHILQVKLDFSASFYKAGSCSNKYLHPALLQSLPMFVSGHWGECGQQSHVFSWQQQPGNKNLRAASTMQAAYPGTPAHTRTCKEEVLAKTLSRVSGRALCIKTDALTS